ncbi:FAD binding domain-containing protein [Didymella exigua CBS 183.55]|uniref:FAD binding domain-containing protein n=1 Tax=Didymella exigua CBS 183.55 TaxID=1150837 RepID=A0A6A5RR98_9PLEO|nr:FAD binding domain-containing protein [Didymella exigua CBS 183.55]KAF1928846.1 FAD binding domain-containing protein [Didymella exigua CBS 183.55]
MFGLKVTLLAAALTPLAVAQNETDLCCTALAGSSLKARLLYPGQTAFESRLDSYFDVKQQSLTPSCIVQPKNTKEVALTIKTLTAVSSAKSCKFAIRSGGHTPYAGASNIEDGVTIDLQYISAVQYDSKNSLVKVGPGARWNDVFTTLEPLGVITTGGRSSTVGVGGLTLGGGISYFSPEHGLICDNVLEFEVVLADSRVVTASKTQNPDLFTVLKGGNNNFGIVTQIKFRTFKYDGMWGGLVVYPETTIQDQFKALIKFSNNVDKNVKSSAIVMPVYQSSVGADLILNAYDHAEPVVRPAAFDEFLAIPGNVSDSTAVTNMSDLAAALEGSTTSSVYFGTLTFANDLRVMTEAHEIYKDVLANLKARATGDWQIYVLYQPLPPAYWKDSAARGGNVLGLERFNGQTLCLYQPYISWQGAEQDALFQQAGADLVNRIRAYAVSIGADNPYLYLDYADNTQDPLTGYGAENVKKMKAAAKKYDPKQIFQKNVPGGFKISKVA